ncbi:MAG: hypothetical protein K0R47_3777 [Brevibacillus sp.]|jgi:uncharacterized protein YeaO (DUF488 family)|nr:hypothetical protein [Brevibacillus sp.]
MIQIKRVYEEASEEDGRRVLVDRVWPRGISKEKAQLDEWMKQIAPSPYLRKWFCHIPERFEEFKERYKQELEETRECQEAVSRLLEWDKEGTVTLVYAARDQEYNHVVVLQDFLTSRYVRSAIK